MVQTQDASTKWEPPLLGRALATQASQDPYSRRIRADYLLYSATRTSRCQTSSVNVSAFDSETQERMVVYQALCGDRKYWVRPEKMFFEHIERNGKRFSRFQEIDWEE